MYLKDLEEEEQTKPKINARKEINKIETKKYKRSTKQSII